MTPGARVAAAIECLDRILEGTPAERALTNWARASRFAGSKDRAAVRDHVFDALRCRASYAALGGAMTGRGLMIGAVRDAGQDVDALFSGEGHAPSPLSEAERAMPAGDLPTDLPAVMRDLLQSQLSPEDIDRIDRLYRCRAPVCLRVRQGAMTTDQAAVQLRATGIETRLVDGVPTALIVTTGARQVRNHPLYLNGAIELQDSAAQALCLDLPVADGDRVLDYCAGGGGKILALGDRAKIAGFAHDADAGRMTDITPRASRAGLRVKTVAPGQVKGQFDLVLTDVPCSGSGTWRRAPEAKWAFTSDRLSELTALQAQILNEAAQFVRPGGTFAYATCSIFTQENQDQVAHFVNQSDRFQIVRQNLSLPDEDGDGFYVAVLKCVK